MQSIISSLIRLNNHRKAGVNPLVLYKIYQSLLKSQYFDYREIKLIQFNNIMNLINMAKERSLYYSKLYENITVLNDSLSIFEQLPSISKREIINYANEMVIDSKTADTVATTSGSTGEPLRVKISPEAVMYRIAGRMRFYKWWSISQNDKNVLIWGIRNRDISKAFYHKWIQFFKSQLLINVFELSKSSIHFHIKNINLHNPVFIRGYKSGIVQLAELMVENNIQIVSSRLRLIIVTSEVLYEDEREYLSRVFKCNVANEYGSAESGLFAFECPQGKMHILEEAVLLETNSNNELFVTELNNVSTAIINYKNEDIVHISNNECPCGRKLRCIDKIEGRQNDFILKPDGSKLSQYVFYYIMKEIEQVGFSNAIKRYSVVQTNFNFDFFIIPSDNYNKEVELYIRNRVYELIGENITISIIIVDQIPLEKSGKLRFFRRIE